MDIIEASLIIVIGLIVNGAATLLVLKYYLQKMNLQPYIRMAKAYASQMGTKSQQVQHTTRQKQMAQEAKGKVAKAAIEELPMGGILKRVIDKSGISPDEIFALVQDENFMKGIMVIINTFGGIISKVTGKGEKEKEGVQNYIGGDSLQR